MTPLKSKFRWEVSARAPETQFETLDDLPRLVVQILYNRGLVEPPTVRDFISDALNLGDPFVLPGMTQAVERIIQAINAGERMAIYGDYDADGVTSTALLTQALEQMGAEVIPYIPNRFEEGYGLNTEAIAALAEQDVSLIITVDCGIRAAAEVLYGNSLGLDFVVTDHHQIPKDENGADVLPAAVAVINPKRQDSVYPFEDFAGVGVAFKLAQALSLRLGAERDGSSGLVATDILDLAALGTVADMVPLKGENRSLVQRGLQVLNQLNRVGLRALLAHSHSQTKEVTATTIGFVLGPRLNAAGRLDHAQLACQLLLTADSAEADDLAQQLNQLNVERQDMTRTYVEQARAEIYTGDGPKAALHVIAAPNFNHGVVGLVASRLTDELYRPVLVAHQDEVYTKGSGRSIPEFNITDALDQCADLLVKYGGHAAAAGFTVENQNLAALRERLQAIAEAELAGQSLQRSLCIDAEINLRPVTPTLVEQIASLEPFGYGNPQPIFMTQELVVQQCRPVGRDNAHLKLKLFDGKQVWDAIGFRMGEWAEHLGPGVMVDAAYHLEFNEWQGRRSMQLNLQDLRFREEF